MQLRDSLILKMLNSFLTYNASIILKCFTVPKMLKKMLA